MTPAHLGGQLVVTQCSPHQRNLVRADVHADPASTDQYRPIGVLVGDGLGGRVSQVRIVTTLAAVGAHIQDFMPLLVEQHGDFFLCGMAAMIGR